MKWYSVPQKQPDENQAVSQFDLFGFASFIQLKINSYHATFLKRQKYKLILKWNKMNVCENKYTS